MVHTLRTSSAREIKYSCFVSSSCFCRAASFLSATAFAARKRSNAASSSNTWSWRGVSTCSTHMEVASKTTKKKPYQTPCHWLILANGASHTVHAQRHVHCRGGQVSVQTVAITTAATTTSQPQRTCAMLRMPIPFPPCVWAEAHADHGSLQVLTNRCDALSRLRIPDLRRTVRRTRCYQTRVLGEANVIHPVSMALCSKQQRVNTQMSNELPSAPLTCLSQRQQRASTATTRTCCLGGL